LVDGLTKNQSTLGSFTIGGKTYTVAQAIVLITSSMAASKEVEVERAAFEAALAAEKATRAQNRVFVSSLKQTLQAMYVGQVDKLAEYGLKGRKPRVVPPKTQVAAAARAKATRELRGTKGKKQKAAIHAPAVEVTTSPATQGSAPTGNAAATASASATAPAPALASAPVSVSVSAPTKAS
jgi:hypothetical protein